MKARAQLTVLLTALLAASALTPTGAADGKEPGFRYERRVEPGASGPNRLEPDAILMGGAAPLVYDAGLKPGELGPYRGGLADLRLADNLGRPVPYLVIAPPSQAPQWRPGHLLPVAATKTESGFEVDFGIAGTFDRVRITGLPAPFLKRFRLEGSGDRSRWTLLVAEASLFDLPEDHLRRLDVDFMAGNYRYVRLTWDDRSSARTPLPGEVAARLVPSVAAAPPARIPVRFERRPSEPGKSRFRLRLPASRLPVVALSLEVPGGPGGPLLRPAVVTEGRLTADAAGGGSDIQPARLGEATLRRAVRDGLSASDLRIPLAALPEGPDLELTVDDGSNPPLEIAGVTAELAPLPWIYFEAQGTSVLTARFGDRKASSPPRYDLEALRDQVSRARTATARWGEIRNPESQEKVETSSPLPALGAPVDPEKFRYRREIPAGPQGLTALLLDAAVLSRSSGLADLRIADGQGRQVPYLLERLDEPISLPLAAPVRQATKGDPPSLSRYAIQLPYPSLPGARLVLTTSARVFEREIRIVEIPAPASARRSDPDPEERTVAQAAWRHSDPETRAPQLTLELPSSPAAHFELLIEEGDNAPLPLDPPHLLLPAHRLRFFYPANAHLTLLYGQPDLPPPRYDLALLAPQLLGQTAHEINLGSEPRQAAEADPDATGKKIFWGALVGAVLVLLLILGRMLRGGAEGAG